LTLAHSQSQLAIESRANYVMMLRYKSLNNGVRTGELSNRMTTGTFIDAYFEMPRLWDTQYVNSPEF